MGPKLFVSSGTHLISKMDEEGTIQSYEELSANLKEYQEQLKAVEDLLLDDAENDELLEMHKSLEEVIQLTSDLLKDARAQADEQSKSLAAQPYSHAAPAGPSSSRSSNLTAIKIVTPPSLNLPSILPASVAEQLRKAQIKVSRHSYSRYASPVKDIKGYCHVSLVAGISCPGILLSLHVSKAQSILLLRPVYYVYLMC